MQWQSAAAAKVKDRQERKMCARPRAIPVSGSAHEPARGPDAGAREHAAPARKRPLRELA
jgi:hypothetical protein